MNRSPVSNPATLNRLPTFTTLCSLDFETGGLDPMAHALTAVGVSLFEFNPCAAPSDINPVVIEGYGRYLHPARNLSVSENAARIQGRTMAEIYANGDDEILAFHQMRVMWEVHECPRFVAHGADFESDFLRAWSKRAGYQDFGGDLRRGMVCTQRLTAFCRSLSLLDPDGKNDLDSALKEFGLKRSPKPGDSKKTAHDAGEDAYLTGLLFVHLTDRIRQAFGQQALLDITRNHGSSAVIPAGTFIPGRGFTSLDTPIQNADAKNNAAIHWVPATLAAPLVTREAAIRALKTTTPRRKSVPGVQRIEGEIVTKEADGTERKWGPFCGQWVKQFPYQQSALVLYGNLLYGLEGDNPISPELPPDVSNGWRHFHDFTITKDHATGKVTKIDWTPVTLKDPRPAQGRRFQVVRDVTARSAADTPVPLKQGAIVTLHRRFYDPQTHQLNTGSTIVWLLVPASWQSWYCAEEYLPLIENAGEVPPFLEPVSAFPETITIPEQDAAATDAAPEQTRRMREGARFRFNREEHLPVMPDDTETDPTKKAIYVYSEGTVVTLRAANRESGSEVLTLWRLQPEPDPNPIFQTLAGGAHIPDTFDVPDYLDEITDEEWARYPAQGKRFQFKHKVTINLDGEAEPFGKSFAANIRTLTFFAGLVVELQYVKSDGAATVWKMQPTDGAAVNLETVPCFTTTNEVPAYLEPVAVTSLPHAHHSLIPGEGKQFRFRETVTVTTDGRVLTPAEIDDPRIQRVVYYAGTVVRLEAIRLFGSDGGIQGWRMFEQETTAAAHFGATETVPDYLEPAD